MKTLYFLIAVLTTVLGAGAILAPVGMRTTIPFDFYAGRKVLPTGDYEIFDQGSGLLWVVRSDREAGAFLSTFALPPTKETSTPAFVFRCYVETCFLVEIRRSGGDSGKGLRPTPAERAAARDAKAVQEIVPICK